MAVCRITNNEFEPLAETSFETEKLYERYDLQRMLHDRPHLLEEGLFIVAEEYNDREESNRRIDLLALDREGRLVVVELKRSDQDSLMDLQAIRYAAMVANMTLDQAIDAHREYLRQREMDGDVDVLVQAHLRSYDAGTRISTANPRIILVSANFSKELTTSVLWLNQGDMDITCIKLQPFKSGKELFLEASQVIPMPEGADYMVRLRNREREAEGRGSYQPVTSQGAAEFQEAIKTARADQRERLESLYELAAVARAILSQRRTVLDDVNTIAAYAQDMSEFLKESEFTERSAFIETFVKEIVVMPGDALLRYTIPMPDDNPIPGRNAEEMALNGSVRSTVNNGGAYGIVWRVGGDGV